MSIIVIDPGHGGTQTVGNSGANHATGPLGTKEKDLVLDLAVRTADYLTHKGHTVFLTRNNDVNLDLKDRAAIAKMRNAAVFVSIHFNGNSNATIQGTETWVHTVSTDDSRLLAASVQQRLVSVTGYRNRGVKSKGLGVLSLAYHTPTTAVCLAEISFLTDPSEESRLLNGVSYKNKIAEALGIAIIDFINRSSSIPHVNPAPEGIPTGDADI